MDSIEETTVQYLSDKGFDFANQVICGNCEDVLSKMEDECIDLIVTDVPYGKNYKSNRQGIDRERSNRREGDIVIRESYFETINNDDHVPLAWLPNAFRVLRTGGAMYVFIHWDTWDVLKPAVANIGFKVKNMIVMNKSNHGMGDLRGGYAPKHELLLFATKGRHILRHPKRLNDVWDVPVRFSGARRLHPNEKPLSWITPAIVGSSDVGDVVLDPFCGSGGFLKAANELGRYWIGIDNDPQWINVCRENIFGIDL